MKQLTILMYHYVRPIIKSQYPGIKGLEFEAFKRQLDYLSSRYTFITAEQLIACSLGNGELPLKSCYLTFDDGFKDHIKHVMPELLSRNIQGSFFPPVDAIVKREMLDVHALHFILESRPDYRALVVELNKTYLDYGGTSLDIELLQNTWHVPSGYDSGEVMYIKHMLQHALPFNTRSKIVAKFFKKYVGRIQSDFADELYVSTSDIKILLEHGMYVGSHGCRHVWLDKESKKSQILEIDLSLQFLKKVGAPTKDWIMCYPFGAYNNDTLSILKSRNCRIGLTTKPGLAEFNQSNMLELSRFDTNDFHK